ncbi:MAG: hypothetical protein OEV44_05445 [Spirochaetota bacterium]|nr:hypothetical protein [Spirochaetota bacterium]
MMKIIISLVIFLNVFFLSCGANDKETERYKKYYENEVKHFQTTKYFKKEGLIEEVQDDAITGLVEYYKVSFNDKNIPLKEEYYNHGMKWYKVYYYNEIRGKLTLKSISFFNINKILLNENIYENKKVVSSVKYFYSPKDEYKIREEHYKNGIPNGWWSYFNPSGTAYKKEFYKEGKLDNYWLYYYDNSNKLIREENYNNINKLLYKHSFK